MDFALNRCNSSSFRCLTIISFQLFQLYKLAITLDFHCFVYLKMISDFFSVIFCKGTGKGMKVVPRPIAIYLVHDCSTFFGQLLTLTEVARVGANSWSSWSHCNCRRRQLTPTPQPQPPTRTCHSTKNIINVLLNEKSWSRCWMIVNCLSTFWEDSQFTPNSTRSLQRS